MTTPAPEDHRRSLADLAQRDLDAALQLLAERAQYITAASGAAIALRRGDHHDMLCRASAGSNAPELGAILSMDYGLSGESVRTRQLLRCDDVSSDSRVNHEVCRQLGIASVVVMPIVSDDQALGVFELLSGEPRAFEERDLSALRRLSELVELAVKHAVLAQSMPSAPETIAPEVTDEPQPTPSAAASVAAVEQIHSIEKESRADPISAAPMGVLPNLIADAKIAKATEPTPGEKTEAVAEKIGPERQPTSTPETKPRFWSAATHTDSAASVVSAESTRVPPGLRNLQKCQACGFPVSPGRTYCVECEEKQWRGQPLTKPAASLAPTERAQPETVPVKVSEVYAGAAPPPSSPLLPSSDTPQLASNPRQNSAEEFPRPEDDTLFLTSSTPSESWLSANRYVLIALFAVAIVIAAIAFLR
jgi:hypothetical protein